MMSDEGKSFMRLSSDALASRRRGGRHGCRGREGRGRSYDRRLRQRSARPPIKRRCMPLTFSAIRSAAASSNCSRTASTRRVRSRRSCRRNSGSRSRPCRNTFGSARERVRECAHRRHAAPLHGGRRRDAGSRCVARALPRLLDPQARCARHRSRARQEEAAKDAPTVKKSKRQSLKVKTDRQVDLARIRDARRLQEILRRHHAAEAGVVRAVGQVLGRHADGDALLTATAAATAGRRRPDAPRSGPGGCADRNRVRHVRRERRSPRQPRAVARRQQRPIVEDRIAVVVGAGRDRVRRAAVGVPAQLAR